MTMDHHIEQDRGPSLNDDDLPTYDDLAAQEGPNSRFGRWRGWIEKRAAERYMAITPEERARRRERGWGNEEMDSLDPDSDPDLEPPTPSVARLSIQTNHLRYSTLSEPPPDSPLPPLPAVSTRLHPTHLKMNHFGSRFLPHSTVPIRCLLPLASDHMLLVGTDEGLSVLDMFPQEWTEQGGVELKGPDDAKVRVIWEGETVYQMSILEPDNARGVVLMLVGPQAESPSGKDSDGQRTIRMYNLGSLTSLAKWTIANKGERPLNLGGYAAQQTTPKKHRPTNSIARGLKSLIPPASSSSSVNTPDHHGAQSHSYQVLVSPSPSLSGSNSAPRPPPKPSPNRPMSGESSWELVVNELPLRWARDFVPLAAPGSRLAGVPVICFALWSRGGQGQFLAVATKGNILLYETPPNERAFRFVKEFYTPLQPKSITFFQQSVQELGRSLSDVDPHHSHSHSHIKHRRSGSGGGRPSSASKTLLNYGTQLCIFAIFEKKAGWIRIADSAAGEMELFDDIGGSGSKESLSLHARTPSSASVAAGGGGRRRGVSGAGSDSGVGLGAGGSGGGGGGRWLPPVRAELPGHNTSVYALTRGATTHIVPCPVPAGGAQGARPLWVLSWRVPPGHVAVRVGGSPAVLQLTALGVGFVEVAEVSVEALLHHPSGGGHGHGGGHGKGKGKAPAAEAPVVVRAEEDAGGETGFLCLGGHWDHAQDSDGYPVGSAPMMLQRMYSTGSDVSGSSYTSQEVGERLRREQGIYGWCRKGVADWRVFWLGGSFSGVDDDERDGDPAERL